MTVDLMKILVENSSQVGDTVLDHFMGVGVRKYTDEHKHYRKVTQKGVLPTVIYT